MFIIKTKENVKIDTLFLTLIEIKKKKKKEEEEEEEEEEDRDPR